MSKSSEIASICACFYALPVLIALTCVLLIFPLYLLIVGIINLDSCPIDSRIPIWMICMACLLIIERMMECTNQSMEQRFLSNNPKPAVRDGKEIMMKWEEKRHAYRSLTLIFIVSFSRLAIFVSTIVGSVFVFSSYSNRSQCNGLLYWSAFVYCIIALSVFLIGGIVVCGIFFIITIVSGRARIHGVKK